MSDHVQIANAAAAIVGHGPRLTAPSDDTVLGRAVAAVWDTERKAALRDGAWNFAMKRDELPALAQSPIHGFEAQFQLPADSLKLMNVYELRNDRWQLEGRAILADTVGPLRVRYLADITEPSEFDPLFAQVFARRIACAIGNRIAGSAFKEELNWEKYREELRQARMSDAMENPGVEQAESEWVEGRWNTFAEDYRYSSYFLPTGVLAS